MPIFKVDIEKSLEGEYWTNRYLVLADDLATAVIHAQDIKSVERNIHATEVLFTKYRVSDTSVGTDVYVTFPVNDNGLSSHSSPLLPLFNVLRVDMVVPVGRPSRKYYRGILSEGSSTFNTIDSGSLGGYNTALLDLLDLPICDPQGSLITGYIAWPSVGMRQLRRGTRRRATPVIPG